ncbi:30S ribosomal protein S12 methylthiotransferase RimO [Spiractinospora alimapuensis]|uniref:30S ribosomal protein S12 methylthiotransferase RimO n=1 Tax=Spiractinospora alimapuensis TaxID=2820884 RepID=UPI001EE9C798|nr:30S ribosomal protein S12 methylthiotransferase RimO [Spiractinospora alimapuensis]QVQ53641.1 30S ribosomal protein S12 methylthiotransferase RimO [Spiractinospora alimapuensis]
MAPSRTVSLVTLGCARNEVDSEELAGRLSADGWNVVDPGERADVVMVNTCGFIDAAKRESIDTLLDASDDAATVVAAGCMAERYGSELAEALPEATVLSFDDYAQISERLDDARAGRSRPAHAPRDRRTLLPITPVDRAAADDVHVPGHGSFTSPEPSVPGPASGPRIPRLRFGDGPVANLKIASGCDRRCSFCAIPAFRGAYVSRPPEDVLAEAEWLAGQGVRELYLVSENSTSYGKDLGDLRALEKLLPRLAEVPGIERVRPSYLQPAEIRPGLIDVLTSTPGVTPYFDLSFQHAAEPVLRRMRRFGGSERFLELLSTIRARAPHAGARANFIVGFPGETERDVAELADFLREARLDAIGIFGYSDEEGTEAAGLDDKLSDEIIAERANQLNQLAEELMAQRAEERIGTPVSVLVEAERGEGWFEARAEHQAPEVDGATLLYASTPYAPGDIVSATVVGSDGVDLTAEPDGAGHPVDTIDDVAERA